MDTPKRGLQTFDTLHWRNRSLQHLRMPTWLGIAQNGDKKNTFVKKIKIGMYVL